jgi:uncharacterized repeat protein (TIGR03837 family)
MKQWDIFCRVIDNFGDIGVCWRLACGLAARGQSVRLWVDDASALAWMAPDGYAGVQVMAWQPDQPMPQDLLPGDVVIEAFGCEIDQAWIATNSIALGAHSITGTDSKGLKNPVWINLEYLSAELYAQRNHGLHSPVMSGAAQGMEKWFFYPGFTAGTGGLLREADAIGHLPTIAHAERRISLFCYEPPALKQLLEQLASAHESSHLAVMQGRAQVAVNTVLQSKNGLSPLWNVRSMLSIQEQGLLPQPQYDALLNSCDLNFVRGEDSLVRAIWAGSALVWQIYPQADGAHAAKLEAFLEWLQAPPDLREFHRVWNGLSQAALPDLDLPTWSACVKAAQMRLLAQPELVSQLLDFAQEKRNSAA